jgi:hypothetical protein
VIELRPMQSVSSPTNRLVSGYVGGNAIQWRSMQSCQWVMLAVM